MDRYHRQTLLPQIGAHGQAALKKSTALIIGCGALGSVIADQLVRAGVGKLVIADRDIVELTNLQRQVLFTEADVRDSVPKAIGAANRLRAVNSEITIDPLVVDIHSGNIEEILATSRPTVILDGTDNVQTRYLLNDVSVKHAIPYIYGACVGTEGRVALFHPPHTACLRCLFAEPAAAGELPTCDTAGVLGPIAGVVASMQALAAIKLLTGNPIAPELLMLELWSNRIRSISFADSKRADCPTCAMRHFEFLNRPANSAVTLCGRNALQLLPDTRQPAFDLARAASSLQSAGQVTRTPYFLKCTTPDGMVLMLFPDGRLVAQGTTDASRVRSLYARYIGT